MINKYIYQKTIKTTTTAAAATITAAATTTIGVVGASHNSNAN